jgi:hypothetical protein
VVGDVATGAKAAPKVVAVLAMHGRISAAQVRARLAEDDLLVEDASFLLVALGAVGSERDMDAIRDFVARRPDGEEGVRIAAVLALHQLHAPASYASQFLNGIFESTKLALDWIVDVDPAGAVRLMREAMQGRTGHSFVKFARRLPLEPDDIEFLETAVARGDDAAAGILAQIQPAEKVVRLLSNRNRRVRSETAAWAPANPKMSEKAIEESASPLPNGFIRQLRGDLRTRQTIVELLNAAPLETRPWRAKLLAAAWRPQLRAGLLQLLEEYRESSVMRNFWAIRTISP